VLLPVLLLLLLLEALLLKALPRLRPLQLQCTAAGGVACASRNPR